MSTHNIPLNVLDEYAKVLTTKQSNMLYENKCNKKYKKVLYEDKKYQSNSSYRIYLNAYTLDEANINVTKALARYVSKYNLQYNVVNDGVYLYTPLAENYMGLLENLVNDGFNVEALKNVVNVNEARKYLDNLK